MCKREHSVNGLHNRVGSIPSYLTVEQAKHEIGIQWLPSYDILSQGSV